MKTVAIPYNSYYKLGHGYRYLKIKKKIRNVYKDIKGTYTGKDPRYSPICKRLGRKLYRKWRKTKKMDAKFWAITKWMNKQEPKRRTKKKHLKREHNSANGRRDSKWWKIPKAQVKLNHYRKKDGKKLKGCNLQTSVSNLRYRRNDRKCTLLQYLTKTLKLTDSSVA